LGGPLSWIARAAIHIVSLPRTKLMKSTGHLWLEIFLSILTSLFLASPSSARAAARANSTQEFLASLRYISEAWNLLTRSMTECKTVYDPKAPRASTVYLPAGFPVPPQVKELEASCPVHVRRLPEVIHGLGEIKAGQIHTPGLLYLPHPYVVPGGIFNEMYGWDSYFILRGLLQAGRLDLARGIVENFFFEIGHYGAILNANRTFYLTRSQPPFLSEMVRAVYDAEESRGRDDRAWLKEAYRYIVKTERFWTQPPHLAGTTGLSRYFALGEGPVQELGASSDSYYRHAASYLVAHPDVAGGYLVWLRGGDESHLGSRFPLYVCNPGDGTPMRASDQMCERAGSVALSSAFYKGDRSLRESGFDITFRFGPFGDATPDYAAVGLNCLLYRQEKDLEWISDHLGEAAQARQWQAAAEQRAQRISRYFWNEHRGLYFDYDFKTGKQSHYVYATTFYPLWVGAASRAQARTVIKQAQVLEKPGGVVMSLQTTDGQWDYPYGWAPIQLIAVEGLRRYGDDADANRISTNFLSMIAENFERDHAIYEKYNVVTRSSETHVRVGYKQNQVGFGWTNGVFLTLLRELPAAWLERIENPEPQAALRTSMRRRLPSAANADSIWFRRE
jgi:alpha,alpha-trehalase